MLSDDYLYRFGGIARLYGQPALEKLARCHALVIGVGGVGSWAAEALARTGVGQLTLVDHDDVCLSNTNRQLPAITDQVGRFKVAVLAERFRGINPELKTKTLSEPFTAASAESILQTPYDVVVDAIDDLANKCLLIAECHQRHLPVVTTGGAGGRRNPALIQVADLTESFQDPLLAQVRKVLRKQYGFSREEGVRFGVPTVFSTERPYYPTADGCVVQEGKDKPQGPLDCTTGYGTATFVTGAYGFTAASAAVQILVNPTNSST
ncbi:MAG: tRNA threonylcarbamoyladenosine dehydratase [Bdellovibrionales bacterium]|nr:tRNA threonylcarbamoyladenosine dehydratase [Bdellovibrionales bacterium]